MREVDGMSETDTAWRRGLVVACLSLAVAAACGGSEPAVALKEVQRAHSGAMDVVVLSQSGAIARGKGAFVLEFRDAGGALVDVGTVTVNATMPMAGMAPMFGGAVVMPDATKGRYTVTSDLGMAGTWRLSVEWNGSAGSGSAVVSGTVL